MATNTITLALKHKEEIGHVQYHSCTQGIVLFHIDLLINEIDHLFCDCLAGNVDGEEVICLCGFVDAAVAEEVAINWVQVVRNFKIVFVDIACSSVTSSMSAGPTVTLLDEKRSNEQ